MINKLWCLTKHFISFFMILLLLPFPAFGQRVGQGQGKNVSANSQSQQSARQQVPVKTLKRVDMATAYRIWVDWYEAQQQGIKKPVPTLSVLNADEKETNRLNAIWNKAKLQAQSDLQRKFEQKNKLTVQTQSEEQTLTIDPRTNRITNPGYSYDANGNLIAKPGATFAYDAENRLKTANVNGVVTNYFYDGLGRRVKKVVDGVTTRFIYDHEGKLIAEYTGDPVPSTPTKEYVYGSNGLLAVIEPNNPDPNQAIKYLTPDHLNTPRVVTDVQGNIISRHDYYPFGQEIAPNIGNRTTIEGYSGMDSVRQKFTGYEKDEETGLDFAQARYFNSGLGRFMSVDPLGKSEKLEDPQTWNRYSYVLNNPLRYTDPDGQAPQEGADIRQRQDIKDLMDGKISQQEYQDRQRARAVGAIIGAGIVGGYIAGKAALLGIAAFVFRNPSAIQQLGNEALQMSSGNPLPSPSSSFNVGIRELGEGREGFQLLAKTIRGFEEEYQATKVVRQLTDIEKSALRDNVRGVIQNTIDRAITLKGEGGSLKSISNQLNKDRFKFIDQVPEAKQALQQALDQVNKVTGSSFQVPK